MKMGHTRVRRVSAGFTNRRRFQCEEPPCHASPCSVCGQSVASVARLHRPAARQSLYMTFDPENCDRVAEALTTKYGPADSTTTEQVHNRMGATFTNETMPWRFSDGILKAERYSSSLSEGDIFAVGDSGFAEYSKHNKDRCGSSRGERPWISDQT